METFYTYFVTLMEVHMKNYLLTVLIVFLLVSVRYLAIAGTSYLVFWKWKKEDFKFLRIQKTDPSRKKISNEIKWSFSTFIIFAFIGANLRFAHLNGLTRIYDNISDYGIAYYIFSIIAMLIIHDTYFYWAHRFMHLKPVFKYIHKIHHESTNPTPLAAFSFHPLEALIEALVVPMIALIMPVHMSAVFIFLVCMTIMNAMGHLGFELYPQGFTRHSIGKFFNTSTHHNIHHKYFNSNYGLYWNYWDMLMNTNHPKYHEAFNEIKERTPSVNNDQLPKRQLSESGLMN
jgi:lathosterol oxidase